MTARDAHLDLIVQGCRLILEGLQQQHRGYALRDDGFVLAYEDGLNPREISDDVRERLEREGFSDGQIAKLGVSSWNIRPIVKHRTT